MKKIIIYIYNSYQDPLFQSNMYKYMIDAADQLGYDFVLITYEQDEFLISKTERKEILDKLAKKNIHWIPLKWHSGRLKLIKKIFDLLLGLFVIVKYRLRGYNRIVSLATVSGSFAYVYSFIFRMRHYLYQYEPHSEFMSDFGYWKKNSLSYLILNRLEHLSGKYSAVVATGTHHMISRLKKIGSKASVFKIPSCVDEKVFEFSLESREAIRTSLNVENRKVLVYAGKFGGIYFEKETIEIFAHLHKSDPSFFFLILTPNPVEEIGALCSKYDLKEGDYHITRVPFLEMSKYLSAADMGLVAVPSYPSQKFRSPIKVGEYLCCGLPYIVARGISEDDEWAEKYNVGIVLEKYEEEDVRNGIPKIQKLLSEDRSQLRIRCRQVGMEYRGFQKFSKVSLEAFVEI